MWPILVDAAPNLRRPANPGRFDAHLAEIDNDWLFLFGYRNRIIVTDIYGNKVKVFHVSGGEMR